MDEFEKKLKRDAADIDAAVSPELEDRIRASLLAAGRHVPAPDTKAGGYRGLWLASSLTGLAAAAAIVAFLNLNEPESPQAPPVTSTVPSYTEYMEQLQQSLPLRTETAEFAGGLEEELEHLRADFEKARENVSRDIDFTF